MPLAVLLRLLRRRRVGRRGRAADELRRGYASFRRAKGAVRGSANRIAKIARCNVDTDSPCLAVIWLTISLAMLSSLNVGGPRRRRTDGPLCWRWMQFFPHPYKKLLEI